MPKPPAAKPRPAAPAVPPAEWRDEALAAKWDAIRRARRVVTAALEVKQTDKTIGASLEAAPVVHVEDRDMLAALKSVDFADVCITSGIAITTASAPAGSSTMPSTASWSRMVSAASKFFAARAALRCSTSASSRWPDTQFAAATSRRDLIRCRVDGVREIAERIGRVDVVTAVDDHVDQPRNHVGVTS